MRFYPLSIIVDDDKLLASEYKEGREIGKVRLGDTCLFCRVGLKTYYIPYTAIHRFFRRVEEVEAKMCCAGGDFSIENIVICDEEKELLQVQLPGAKAARILVDELKAKAPEAVFGLPEKES